MPSVVQEGARCIFVRAAVFIILALVLAAVVVLVVKAVVVMLQARKCVLSYSQCQRRNSRRRSNQSMQLCEPQLRRLAIAWALGKSLELLAVGLNC